MTTKRDMLIGEVFSDRYKISKLLGSGSYGSVYLSRDMDVGRDVALKVLKPGEDPQFYDDTGYDVGALESFKLEATLVAHLRCPNTVTLHDFRHFENAEGNLVVYMVFEHVPGQDLERLIYERGALSTDMTMDIAVQVLTSLAEAHEGPYGDIVEGSPQVRHPILHRDVKPGNIMVWMDEEKNKVTVKVLDFGMSKLMKAPNTVRTAIGAKTGTPRYRSPEQRNAEQDLTPASDLFGVGIVMWQCLSGKLPPAKFLADEDIEIDEELCADEPGLKAIIERLLRFKSHRRYQEAEKVINDIAFLQNHKRPDEVYSTELSKAITESDIEERKADGVKSKGSKPMTTEDDFKTERVRYTGLESKPPFEEESSGEFKIDLDSEKSPAIRVKNINNGGLYLLAGILLVVLGGVAVAKMLPNEKSTMEPAVVQSTEVAKSKAIKTMDLVPAMDAKTTSEISPPKITKSKEKKLVKRRPGQKKKVSSKVAEALEDKNTSKGTETLKAEKQTPEKIVPVKVEKPKTKEVAPATPKKAPDWSLEDYGF